MEKDTPFQRFGDTEARVVRRVAGALDAWRIARCGVGLSTDLRSLEKDEMEDLGGRIARELRYSEAEALDLYRKLQAEVAPNDRRILDAARDVCAALNENQTAARHLGLAPDPDMLLGRLLQIARWAREYREPKAGRSPQAAVSDVLALAEHDDGCTSLIYGASLGTCDCRIRDQILASLPWELAVVDPDGSVEEIAAQFLGAAGLMGGSLDSLAEEFARRVSALGGKPKDPPEIPAPEPEVRERIREVIEEALRGYRMIHTGHDGDGLPLSDLLANTPSEAADEIDGIADCIARAMNGRDDIWETSPQPRDREAIHKALQGWRAATGHPNGIAGLLEKALSGWAMTASQKEGIRESVQGQIEDLADVIAEAVGGASPALDPHELDALREAVRQAHVRLPSLAGAARGKLAAQVATAEAALGKLGTADDPGPEDPEPTEAENLAERVAELERRLRALEEARAVEPWPPSKEALQQLVGAEVIAATGPQFDRLRATQRQHETTIVAEVEKAVAPIRELVHEQLDRVLETLAKAKDRVDGMLKAADLEPLKLLAVDHDDHEARLGAIEAKWEEVLGARWRAEVAEQLCAMAELDEMEDAELALENLKARGLTDGMIEAAVNGEAAEPYDDAVKLEVTSDRADPISGIPESPKDGKP